ncbi:tetratricopeptide repeat protein [Mesorhizobium sp. SP-1A]|uniref:tetratricopeptide repeat protein n=1 Tax=Mesorhizobium sp. SP-1A TaxID=3077840 RepID=UPI0028F6ED6D|nr:tetratricopeptide repeat protein [Mesorhizobium sp. SP-1A]
MTNRFPKCLTGSVLLLSLAVAGCQTASDANHSQVAPSSLMAGGVDPSVSDLEKGKHQFADGNYGLAERHFRQTVEANPQSAEGWLGLAASYDRLRRFDLADRAYEQVVRLEGRRPKVLNNMGYSQYLRGDHTAARRLYLEAQKSSPDDPVIRANLALLN